jgi:peptidoglycan/xylan/chitin deacetylase (PgdA/CDA1 family)
VSPGTTLVEAAERFGLRPASGDLLDVQGGVLRRGAFPGRLLLNSRLAPAATGLEEDDRLRVVDGRSRREPTLHVFVHVPGGIPANPQFTLARPPGAEIERGRLSGKVDPDATRPRGPWRTPKAVALTFDDGPSPDTRRVLAVLERLHVRATFFVVGQLAERYPKLVRRELAAGMGVGSHSYSHPYRPPFERMPHAQILEEIERANEVLMSLWRVPSLFRPPGGSFSPYVIKAAGVYGERVVLWSFDPTDWKAGATAKQIIRRVLGAARPGSIVLLHDGGGDRSQTVKALPEIVMGIRAKHLRLVLLEPRR